MPIDHREYRNLTDYLGRLYQCQPFARNGIEHPAIVHFPSAEQIHDVDSILDPRPPTPESRDFAAYGCTHLRDLLNDKPFLHNGSTFTMMSLSLNPLKLRGALGHYYDMLATCAALEHELREAVAEGRLRAPLRTKYHCQVDARDSLHQGAGRSAAIGIGTLTVFNDAGVYKAMLALRSNKTAIDSGFFHVLPAMMFGPTTTNFADPREWSVKHQVLREVLEELFNMPEERDPQAWDFFHRHPALLHLQDLMDAGSAKLYLTGVIINLLTLRPEISTLLLIHDPGWYKRITADDSDIPFITADETVTNSVVTAPIADDERFLSHFPDALHLQMPVHAVVTMWLGIDLARKEIETI